MSGDDTRSDGGGGEVGTAGGTGTAVSQVDDAEKDSMEQWLDAYFEPSFFRLRYLLLVPVLVSFVGSLVMFYVGAYDTYKALYALIIQGQSSGEAVILPIVKALDAFLIGIILVIFSFGIYDFFISKLDPAEHAGVRPDWFKFDSTGELKNKLIELVLVILAIQFFEQMIANVDGFEDPMLYLIIPAGAAILAVSLGFFKWATE
ncbi:YqhA family protein [Haloparvum alkalitolerans]|uniref:YqhA family protein n=1 Tax=Haloparvum alkalitolerans TaxID=1042953 RepID=UPI003CEC8895